MARGPPGPLLLGPGLLLSVQTEAEQPPHCRSLGKDVLFPQWDEPQARIVPKPFPRRGGGLESSAHQPGSGQPWGVTERPRPHPVLDSVPHAGGGVEGAVPSLTSSHRGLGGSGGKRG